jgi:hypothetical protein
LNFKTFYKRKPVRTVSRILQQKLKFYPQKSFLGRWVPSGIVQGMPVMHLYNPFPKGDW